MNERVKLQERPTAEVVYMIAGWRQWADAGSISSGLPSYLIEQTDARKIGEIDPTDFYLFQIPGTHHLLRPEIRLKEGYRQELRGHENEIFYSGDEHRGLVLFLGDEPHMNAPLYADAFFDVVEALHVKRVIILGGVYGALPYDKEREVGCSYSMPHLKEELADYAVRFSNYEGGASIGTYMADRAEHRDVELIAFYGFVPSYDFSQTQLGMMMQGVRIENDFKAWYDLMRRLNHMLSLGIDLKELEAQSEELTSSMDDKITQLENEIPQLKIREYMAELAENFTERPFEPLGDVWARELGDLLNDLDD